MAEINSGRFNRWIQKLFYIQSGGRASVYNVDPAIQTVLPYLNGVEERYLQGWARFAGVALAGAVAAQFSAGRLRNPAGSGVIAVIEYIAAVQATATTKSFMLLQISNGQPDLASSVVPLRLDFRQSAGSAMHLSAGQSTVNGPLVDLVTTGGFVTYISTPNQELTVMPGDAYEVQDGTANEAVNVSFVWRERVLESSELT